MLQLHYLHYFYIFYVLKLSPPLTDAICYSQMHANYEIKYCKLTFPLGKINSQNVFKGVILWNGGWDIPFEFKIYPTTGLVKLVLNLIFVFMEIFKYVVFFLLLLHLTFWDFISNMKWLTLYMYRLYTHYTVLYLYSICTLEYIHIILYFQSQTMTLT